LRNTSQPMGLARNHGDVVGLNLTGERGQAANSRTSRRPSSFPLEVPFQQTRPGHSRFALPQSWLERMRQPSLRHSSLPQSLGPTLLGRPRKRDRSRNFRNGQVRVFRQQLGKTSLCFGVPSEKRINCNQITIYPGGAGPFDQGALLPQSRLLQGSATKWGAPIPTKALKFIGSNGLRRRARSKCSIEISERPR
jgi:hypothetical protein